MQFCLPLKPVFVAPIPTAFVACVVCQADGGAACVVYEGGDLQPHKVSRTFLGTVINPITVSFKGHRNKGERHQG